MNKIEGQFKTKIGGQFRRFFHSNNGNYLYVSDWDSIWQLNLHLHKIVDSSVYISKNLPSKYFYQMKNAPDGLIYISHLGSSENISGIQKPDSFGTECNFLLDTIHFGNASQGPWADGAMPNTPNFALGKLNCNVGIENINETTQEGINIYPNPTNSLLTISSNQILKSITVFDLVGKEIFNETIINKSATINLEKCQSGLYFIKVVNENGEVTTKKIVKE